MSADNIDTAELRRLHDAATPGTWYAIENTCYCEIRVADGQIGDMCASTCYDPQNLDIEGNVALSKANATCAVAAHNAMHALLDEIEALRETIAAEKQRADDFRTDYICVCMDNEKLAAQVERMRGISK